MEQIQPIQPIPTESATHQLQRDVLPAEVEGQVPDARLPRRAGEGEAMDQHVHVAPELGRADEPDAAGAFGRFAHGGRSRVRPAVQETPGSDR